MLRLVRKAVAKQALIRYAWFLEGVVAFLISLLYYERAPGDRCSRYGYREIETRDKRQETAMEQPSSSIAHSRNARRRSARGMMVDNNEGQIHDGWAGTLALLLADGEPD